MEGVMRVSVVATGIDVQQGRMDTPAPRRSMAAPIMPAPAPAPARAPAEDLFAATAASPPVFQPIYAPPRREPEDFLNADLPPMPRATDRYTLRAPEAQMYDEDDSQNFVIPTARKPGAPSPEALARLQAAVAKSPSPAAAPRPSLGGQSAPIARPAVPAPRPSVEKPAEKPRFAIGNLIGRMSGSSDSNERAPATRPSVPLGYDDEQDLSSDHEKIAIPAFLRRQAN
jgi:cell division protein FtsZ